MRELRFTLVSEGSSDQVLISILEWILRQHLENCAVVPAWYDPSRLHKPPNTLALKIEMSLDLYPCHLLFVHRDADREGREHRLQEIRAAVRLADCELQPIVCVVPVRMQEAWLLFDETALRRAAGNPYGRQPLELPAIRSLEQLPDPKALLHDLLTEAKNLTKRRRKTFAVHAAARRITDYIDDFSPLRALSAFQALENDIVQIIQDQGWNDENVPENVPIE